MQNQNKRGKIFVIEGTDSSGKGTQTDLLYDRLNKEGSPTEKISFPFYDTPSGRIIGQCYLGKKDKGEELGWKGDYCWFGDKANNLGPLETSALYALDRSSSADYIKDTINSGKNMIIDRYYQSNMAHQGGKYSDSEKREELFEKLEWLELEYFGIPKEDMTVFLYLPTHIAFELRKGRDGGKENNDIHENDLDHLKNAENTYLQLSDKYGWNKIDCEDKSKGSIKTREEIHEQVYSSVKEVLD